MWTEIYNWLEQYTGVSYDFSDEIKAIKGNKALIDPYDWMVCVDHVLDGLSDVVSTIDEHWRELPDTLPNRDDLKKIISGYIIGEILKNINNIKRTLHIDPVDISSYDDLTMHTLQLYNLINMLSENEIGYIIENNLYEKYEEDNDNAFSEILNIHKGDITNMSFTVNSIRQDYFDSLEDD